MKRENAYGLLSGSILPCDFILFYCDSISSLIMLPRYLSYLVTRATRYTFRKKPCLVLILHFSTLVVMQ